MRILITSFDYDRNKAAFFRSASASAPQWGKGDTSPVTVAEAVHASTNAPVNYFDAPAYVEAPDTYPDNIRRYWDGGVSGCNNPILAAVTEAIVAKQKPGDIVGLSIGTANVALPSPTTAAEVNSPLTRPTVTPGLITDIRKLATSILDDPPDAASFLAHVMTGADAGVPAGIQSRIVRMNPLISPIGKPGAWTLPGTVAGSNVPALTAAQFKYLVNLDMDAIEDAQVQAISHLADLWVAGGIANQPIRMDTDTLEPEVGPSRFTGAAEAWRLLKAL